MTVSFIGGGNQSTWKKPPISQVNDKFHHVVLYRVHFTVNGIQTHNFSGDGH